jgi:hypothetical protein
MLVSATRVPPATISLPCHCTPECITRATGTVPVHANDRQVNVAVREDIRAERCRSQYNSYLDSTRIRRCTACFRYFHRKQTIHSEIPLTRPGIASKERNHHISVVPMPKSLKQTKDQKPELKTTITKKTACHLPETTHHLA